MTVRAVFDCVVFLQGAAREASPAGVCLQLVKDGQITLCLSPEVFAEIRDVLTRPKTQQKFKTLTPQRVEAFLQEVQCQAVFFPAVAKVFSYPRDPDDEPYLNLAWAAGARYLVSRDKDLLDLMKENTPAGKEFRERFPDLTILDPVAFLQQQFRKPNEG